MRTSTFVKENMLFMITHSTFKFQFLLKIKQNEFFVIFSIFLQHKCQRYWPIEDEEKHFLDMKVTLVSPPLMHLDFYMCCLFSYLRFIIPYPRDMIFFKRVT